MKTDKNILCLSWCDADDVVNYGQILQGLAMMMLLRKCTTGEITYLSYLPRGIKSKIKYILKHLNIRNGHFLSYIRTRKTINKSVKKNDVKFYQIQNKDIPTRLSDGVDVLVCGSDQIWHPQNYDKNFFLAFGNEESKKIAYAVSLPKTHIEPQFEKQYESMKVYLSKFDYIAVREQSSAQFISNLSNKNVVPVMDPTFLVPTGIWEGMIEDIKVKGDYIFVYIPNGIDNEMAKLVAMIKESIKASNALVMITRGKNCIEDATILKFISVGEFLYLIKHAKCVITSSFHAVVFSCIFHTNFYAYNVKHSFRGEDIRLKDVLETLGLESRKINLEGSIQYQNIDFSLVEQKIQEKAEISFDILKKNISQEKGEDEKRERIG